MVAVGHIGPKDGICQGDEKGEKICQIREKKSWRHSKSIILPRPTKNGIQLLTSSLLDLASWRTMVIVGVYQSSCAYRYGEWVYRELHSMPADATHSKGITIRFTRVWLNELRSGNHGAQNSKTM